jgi:hypothetical protein
MILPICITVTKSLAVLNFYCLDLADAGQR